MWLASDGSAELRCVGDRRGRRSEGRGGGEGVQRGRGEAGTMDRAGREGQGKEEVRYRERRGERGREDTWRGRGRRRR